MKKKVVITGGAGFIGSFCAEFYAQAGAHVTILDNLARSRLLGSRRKSVEYNWEYLGRYPKIERIKGDIRDKNDLARALRDDTNLIIHAAGQPGISSSIHNPSLDFCVNAQGTINILEYIRKKLPETSFIYCSTNKVYGENVNYLARKETKTRYQYLCGQGVSEQMPIDHCTHTPYGTSKLTGDIYTQEYARLYGIRTAVFRMSCIYGERQFGFEDQGWIAHFIIAALRDEPITIYGDGKQVRDILYVKDVVRVFNGFFKSRLRHIVCNIGGGRANTLSLLECIHTIEKILGKKISVTFKPWRSADQKIYYTDLSKIKKLLGWEPRVSAKEGLATVIRWAKKNHTFFT